MNLNIAKTKILHFRKKSKNKTRSDHCFTFNSEVIEYAEQYKYLGLVLTKHLDRGKAIEEIHTKANRALALLNHRARSCGGLHFNTYSMLFNQLVHSIVMCNSCIWGHTESKLLASIQQNALRFILGVGKTCPVTGLFGESGWVPYSMMVKFNILRFRRRIMKMDVERLTRKICVWSESLAGDKYKNWAWKTKKVLESIKDFGGTLSTDELWDALAQQESTQWRNTVMTIPLNSQTGGRFRFYRQFKTAPTAEGYILNSVTLNKRRILTQLRCGCLPLQIELGRYRSPKPPTEERLCQLCSSAPEDEPHFLLRCPKLDDHRPSLLTVMADAREDFPTLSDEDKSVAILDLCASHPGVSNLIYSMYIQRCNLLR